MKRYEGRRESHVVEVTVNGRPLTPRLDLWNHSPTGFEWGYQGSGPAQLALALLAHHLGDDAAAVALHQDFKSQVISKLPYHGWTMMDHQIRDALIGLTAPALPQTSLSLNDKPFGNLGDQTGGLRIERALIKPVAVVRLGRIVSTPNALASLTPGDILRGIQRHQAGDWGELSDGDRAANDRALVDGSRIVSAYNADNGTRFWIITEADRSATTILLPEDY